MYKIYDIYNINDICNMSGIQSMVYVYIYIHMYIYNIYTYICIYITCLIHAHMTYMIFVRTGSQLQGGEAATGCLRCLIFVGHFPQISLF